MNRIEELLRQKIADYETVYCGAKKYAAENVHELKDRFLYGEYLSEPVVKKQILFWCTSQCTCEGMVKQLFEYFYQKQSDNYTCIWVVKTYKDRPESIPEDITVVKKNTSAYWEALAKSQYLIGTGMLPVPFVKREEQVYLQILGKAETGGTASDQPEILMTDGRSLKIKGILKTDYLLAESRDSVKEWVKKNPLAGSLYRGTILTGKKEAETVPALADMLTKENRVTSDCDVLSAWKLPGDSRKKVLYLMNWKERREHQVLLETLLQRADSKLEESIVAIPRLGNQFLEAEFETMYANAEKFIYRGRVSFREEDFLMLRMIEKNPLLYMQNREIQEYVNQLMEVEWRRIWGKVSVDRIVLVGNPSMQQFFMACGIDAGERVLVDDGFLEKYPEAEVMFDQVKHLEQECPQLEREQNGSAEILNLDRRCYYIADSYYGENGRVHYKLVQEPELDSILVNAVLQPDEERKEYLIKELESREHVYLIGENARNYQDFLPHAEALDEFIYQYLRFYPTQQEFFGKFGKYYDDSRVLQDPIRRCIKTGEDLA